MCHHTAVTQGTAPTSRGPPCYGTPRLHLPHRLWTPYRLGHPHGPPHGTPPGLATPRTHIAYHICPPFLGPLLRTSLPPADTCPNPGATFPDPASCWRYGGRLVILPITPIRAPWTCSCPLVGQVSGAPPGGPAHPPPLDSFCHHAWTWAAYLRSDRTR